MSYMKNLAMELHEKYRSNPEYSVEELNDILNELKEDLVYELIEKKIAEKGVSYGKHNDN
jgi:ribosomal protein L29